MSGAGDQTGLLFLVTAAVRPEYLVPPACSKIKVHLPAGDVAGNATAFFTGLYPGRILSEGKNSVSGRLLLLKPALRGIRFFVTRLPDNLKVIAGSRTEAISPARLLQLRSGSVAWVHLSARPEKEEERLLRELPKQGLVLYLQLAPESPLTQEPAEAFFSRAPQADLPGNQAEISLLHLFVFALAEAGLGEKSSLQVLEQADTGGLFFREDWRLGLFGALRGGARVTAVALGGIALPRFLRRLSLCCKALRLSPDRPFWEAEGGVEKTASKRLYMVSGEGPKAEQERLFALLQNHLSRYRSADRSEVLGRLEDLGYL